MASNSCPSLGAPWGFHPLLTEGRGLGREVWLPELFLVSRTRVPAPFLLLGALPIQEEVTMEAALAFVSIAVILTVHTDGFVFTRTLCHPVFDLAMEGKGDHKKANTSLLLPKTQVSRPPYSFTSSGSSEYFSGSLLAISSSFLETQTWLLPRQKAWQGRQVPPPTAEPTNSGRHCSQWLPWKPGTGRSEGQSTGVGGAG